MRVGTSYIGSGFVRTKHHRKYYQNGSDAYRLRYYLKSMIVVVE